MVRTLPPLSEMLSYDGTPVAFGEDNDGDVYLVDFGGSVYRFEGEVGPPTAFSIPAASPMLLGILLVTLTLVSLFAIRESLYSLQD